LTAYKCAFYKLIETETFLNLNLMVNLISCIRKHTSVAQFHKNNLLSLEWYSPLTNHLTRIDVKQTFCTPREKKNDRIYIIPHL